MNLPHFMMHYVMLLYHVVLLRVGYYSRLSCLLLTVHRISTHKYLQWLFIFFLFIYLYAPVSVRHKLLLITSFPHAVPSLSSACHLLLCHWTVTCHLVIVTWPSLIKIHNAQQHLVSVDTSFVVCHFVTFLPHLCVWSADVCVILHCSSLLFSSCFSHPCKLYFVSPFLLPFLLLSFFFSCSVRSLLIFMCFIYLLALHCFVSCIFVFLFFVLLSLVIHLSSLFLLSFLSTYLIFILHLTALLHTFL